MTAPFIRNDSQLKPTLVLGLRLTFEGKSVCDWPIDASGTATGVKLTHHGEHKPLHEIIYLFGSKDCDETEIPVGIHTYSFTFQLPSGIPYSSHGPCEGQYGHVGYKVDANLDIHLGFDLHTKREFKVIGYEDLKLFPELRIPCEAEEVKVFCCWCCRSDPLIVRVYIPRAGFAVGEKIPLNIEISNKSSTDVTHTVIALDQVYKLRCTAPRIKTRVIRETVLEVTSKGAKAGESVIFEEQLQLPQDLLISNFRYDKVFQMFYEVKVVAETAGVSVSPELFIPITIGSVGLA